MKRREKPEVFPVVDDDGNETGLAPRHICHDGKSKLLHPVVHLHLFDKHGNLYLQRRSDNKDLLPGKWDTSVGGHINPGEKVEDALKREAAEELKLEKFEFEFIKKYIWESETERELVYSFKGISEQIPEPDREEVSDGRFWTPAEIRRVMGSGILTPNFEHEYTMLFIIH